MNQRTLFNFQIALDAIKANKFRSFLTALGIIFGVAAVIAMLAIGSGAKQEILEQIKLVGVNNIVITPLTQQKESKVEENKKEEKKKFSPGLNLLDIKSIQEIIPDISHISPEVITETSFVANGLTRSGKLIGVTTDFFDISNFTFEEGFRFNENQESNGAPVCIIGKGVKTKFFSKQEAIGSYIKCGTIWLKVIGVIEEQKFSKNAMQNLGIRDYNMDIYTPLKTILIRYKNRSLITKSMLNSEENSDEDNENSDSNNDNNSIHQIDRLVVQLNNSEKLETSSEIISRLLQRRHYGVTDFEITVPILLLKQQQRTKDIFNFVLGAIAGISLLVGGIGIMNIMLASVLERIKEIGIRLSIGATKKDIVQQFVFESILISIGGGIAGIILGIILSKIVSFVAHIPTIISVWSIVISFGVSALTGLAFGITPAKNAAQQDPIKSLRYE
ncbi:MAG: ABC transporter permease [Bacteroidia bacterium]|nr:ABC transporter permease [Bacteroidia bacterium]MCZ2248819.1 ABC transporter permease [Bacteroidia bacterium]